jgi:hypothetical protein
MYNFEKVIKSHFCIFLALGHLIVQNFQLSQYRYDTDVMVPDFGLGIGYPMPILPLNWCRHWYPIPTLPSVSYCYWLKTANFTRFGGQYRADGKVRISYPMGSVTDGKIGIVNPMGLVTDGKISIRNRIHWFPMPIFPLNRYRHRYPITTLASNCCRIGFGGSPNVSGLIF